MAGKTQKKKNDLYTFTTLLLLLRFTRFSFAVVVITPSRKHATIPFAEQFEITTSLWRVSGRASAYL
uniref:Uncharacterized protein n=1 Tax=Anopheles braziliensis TaxID=58242 RepID=A0A2M3ZLU0_9DIPT